jgi:hypothetical protein
MLNWNAEIIIIRPVAACRWPNDSGYPKFQTIGSYLINVNAPANG